MPNVARHILWSVMILWLALVTAIGWRMSQHFIANELDSLASSAEYENLTTARIVDRLFTEMTSVANMAARLSSVIELASRYRVDTPDLTNMTRQERAAILTRDPLVRSVGNLMDRLATDLRYARIYLNNLSLDTITASNWAASDSIVGMIYTKRAYLMDALSDGSGHMFGIARLNKSLSYFVASRVEDEEKESVGVVTVKLDAPDMALYLTGNHIALIVNRQGRVTTASSEAFLLRNVAALMPPDSVETGDNDEDIGDPMNIAAFPDLKHTDQWLIDDHLYLVRSHKLNETEYQLFTLASLDHLAPKLQNYYWIVAFIAASGLPILILISRIISHVMRRRREDQHAADHDILTGLRNRRGIQADLKRHFTIARKLNQRLLIAFIDLDSFKPINDTYGHAFGDKFLIEASRRLKAGLRQGDILGRWGGDEFVVIGLTSSLGQKGKDKVEEKMRFRLTPLLVGTYVLAGCRIDYPGASIGIVNIDPSATSMEAALKEADNLMYSDKQTRRRKQ